MFSSSWSIVGVSKDRFAGRMVGKHIPHIAILIVVAILMAGSGQAQEASLADADKQTIELLVRRVDQHEARVAQLAGGKLPPSGAQTDPAAAHQPDAARHAKQPQTEPPTTNNDNHA